MAQTAKSFSSWKELHSPPPCSQAGHMTKFSQWNVNISEVRYFQVSPKTCHVCSSVLFHFPANGNTVSSVIQH